MADAKPNGLPPPLSLHTSYSASASAQPGTLRDHLLQKTPLVLRALAALFSFLSFVLLLSNQHGDWMQFDHFQEYRYLLAISALAFFYSLLQSLMAVYRLRTAPAADSQTPAIPDFIGDQLVAYLLISALSAAIPITNRMRQAVVNIFTDSTAASISMAFLAFVALAFSAVVTGFKLSKQLYV